MTDASPKGSYQQDVKGRRRMLPEDYAPVWEACCAHCECPEGERVGHDDTCRLGCNDAIEKRTSEGSS